MTAKEESGLRGKVALIPGGSSGVGLAIARALLEKGARVAVASRSPEKLRQAQEKLETGSVPLLFHQADMRRGEEIRRWVDDVYNTWGAVHVLVYSTGIARFAPVQQTDETLWDDMMRTNVGGAFLLTREILRRWNPPEPLHFVFINSVAAEKPFRQCAAYGASKAALRMFADVLREETRREGARVTTVMLGATSTPLWDQVGASFPREKMIPPDSVADVVVSLLESRAMMPEEIWIRPQEGDF
jgi:NAD(P)-dependent dehydrogenase (short-subunit alcohol dehydrogenase family)